MRINRVAESDMDAVGTFFPAPIIGRDVFQALEDYITECDSMRIPPSFSPYLCRDSRFEVLS